MIQKTKIVWFLNCWALSNCFRTSSSWLQNNLLKGMGIKISLGVLWGTLKSQNQKVYLTNCLRNVWEVLLNSKPLCALQSHPDLQKCKATESSQVQGHTVQLLYQESGHLGRAGTELPHWDFINQSFEWTCTISAQNSTFSELENMNNRSCRDDWVLMRASCF